MWSYPKSYSSAFKSYKILNVWNTSVTKKHANKRKQNNKNDNEREILETWN